MTRVAMVIGSVSQQAGGVFFSTRPLAMELAKDSELDVSVLGRRDSSSDSGLEAWGNVEVRGLGLIGPASFGFTPSMSRALGRLDVDVCHVQGLWMYPGLACRRWHSRTGRPYLVSPHGMLEPWALEHHSLRKRIALHLYELANLKSAACVHTLSRVETLSVRNLGIRAPICEIPNGVAAPRWGASSPPWSGRIPDASRVLLYLGRLHPKKNLENLLRAWSELERAAIARADPWWLVIAGWEQAGHGTDLKNLASALGLQRLHFLGPLFDREKSAAFGNAEAFVLPSFSEGLPVVVLEAWSHGLPTLLTPECNLPEGQRSGAAISIGSSMKQILAGLCRLVQMSETARTEMGQKGQRLVRERFAWPTIAATMKSVYRWLSGEGRRPECVDLA
jgi:poly(glycerol-phosphate) alpha-glucosyltransferase